LRKSLLILLLLNCKYFFTQIKIIQQPKLAIQYELGNAWSVTEFSNSDWELPAGNNVCACNGSLNILKAPYGSETEYIYMVVYPSEKKNSTLKKRRHIWQYEFKELDEPDTVVYGNNTYFRMVSKFLPTSVNQRFKEHTVWKLLLVNGNVYYYIYLWTKPGLFIEYQSMFEKILASVKPLPRS
jgi:hypothetical protein